MALVERLAKCPATSCLMLLLAGLTVLRILLRLLCAAKGAVMVRPGAGQAILPSRVDASPTHERVPLVREAFSPAVRRGALAKEAART